MNQFTQHYLQSMEKKGASRWDWISPAVGAITGGGLSGLNSHNNNLTMGEALPLAGIAALSGGLTGKGIRSSVAGSPGVPGKSVADAAMSNGGKVLATIGLDVGGGQLYTMGKRKLENQKLENAILEKQVSAPASRPAAPTVNISAPAAPAAPDVTVNNNTPPSQNLLETVNNFSATTKTLLGIGVAGAAGAGIYSLIQSARANKRKADGLETPPVTNVNVAGGGGAGPGAPAAPGAPSTSAGTLRVTLPTRKAGDNESTVEMPLERIGLSNAILTKLRRDVKRRLRSESDSRTHRIIPAGPLTQGLN